MRKPFVTVGLALSVCCGVGPVAGAFAATSIGSPFTSPTHRALTSDISSTAAQAVSGAAIVQTAMKYLGYPYTATGNSPSTGFSCIGFVSFVYRSNGINLPGDLGHALAYAPQVSFADLLPGDILYFQNTVWNGLSHAAIYIGGGRFIHAEWYNRGVVVSSFNNDPVDGNYWIHKYLTANRPWTGAAVPAPTTGTGSPTGPSGNVGTTTTTTVANGPTGVVSASSLNVRSAPSKNATVVTVVSQGTSVVVLGKSHGWYKVQLPNGQIGWVMARYIGMGGGTPTTTTATGTNGSVGNPTAPTRAGTPTQTTKRTFVSVHTSALLVHSGPSNGTAVVTTVYQGQRLQVLARHGNWLKVRLPGGQVGWINAAYTSAGHPSTGTSPSPSTGTTYGRHAATTVNVRSGPSTRYSVVTVLPAGGAYRVIGSSHGWLHVELPGGAAGWVLGSAVGGGSTPTYHSTTYGHPAAGGYSATVTAAVRMHTRPAIKAPVVTTIAAGTRVRVVASAGTWLRVSVAGRASGYVLRSFVRR